MKKKTINNGTYFHSSNPMKDCIVIYVCWKSNEKRSHNNVKTKQKFVSRYESFLTRCRFFVVVREIKFSVCLCFPDLFQVWMVVWCLTVIWSTDTSTSRDPKNAEVALLKFTLSRSLRPVSVSSLNPMMGTHKKRGIQNLKLVD